MKELKKYISESILDDEDTLLASVQKDKQNLLARMVVATNSKISSYNFFKELERDNCIEWVYDNFPSLRRFKLHLDLNYKNCHVGDTHGFNYLHNSVVIGVTICKKTPALGWQSYDIMTLRYDKLSNKITIIGKNPININEIAYWDVKEFSDFMKDLENFSKKYNLEKIERNSPYIRRRNMQWGFYKILED